jgi:valine--pyruvate aminotransferase
MFKYRVDFDELSIGDDIGAICVSRPTNPTGNVVTDREVEKLSCLAEEKNIPLIIDSAYGLPFPCMVYTDARPIWNKNTIVCLSLSKLGLPAIRTGIVVADEKVVKALGSMNAIMSLTPTSVGATLMREIIKSGEIGRISHDLIQPFYKKKMENAVEAVREQFGDIACRIHKPEGAMFLWIWFENLPVSSLELYERLKKRGVLVVSGHYFFPGLQGKWKHKDECLRVTYAQDDDAIRRGIAIIAEEVKKAYAEVII